MPLTPFQKRIARIIARNRNPDSHVAGGAVINRGESAPRYSDDLDIFHDTIASLAASVAIDEESLRGAGCAVDWMLRTDTLHRAEIGLGDDRLRLDWAADSAFRFFPAQEDEEFGYCLHRADLATNKILALAGRGEIRDFLDALLLDREYLGFGALAWAACGKDPGYTPDLVLQQTNRHSRYREEDLATEHLARAVDLRALKLQWIEARRSAADLFDRLPAADLGCLYLDEAGEPVTPDPDSEGFPALIRHFGSVRGAWPRLADARRD